MSYKKLKKNIISKILGFLVVGSLFLNSVPVFAAPSSSSASYRHLLPFADSTYDLGTELLKWRTIYGDLLRPDAIQFSTTTTPLTSAAGLLQWNQTDETLDLGMPDGITLQIGQENQVKARNNTGVTIPNGSVVYVSGVLGNRPTIALAKGDAHSTSVVLGVTTQDIANNDDGKVTTQGYVRDLNTSAFSEGDILWLSKTTAGAFTNSEPTVPHHSSAIGQVTRSHLTQGSILITIVHHQSLERLSDVNGTPLTIDGQFPVWNNSAGYFDFTSNVNSFISTTTATSTYVPYIGANQNVDLGSFELTTGQLITALFKAPVTTFTFKNLLNSTIAILDSNGSSINSSLAVDTDTLYVNASNNRVGVGTTSPAIQFHVDDPTVAQLRTSSGSRILQMNSYSADTNYLDSTGAQFRIRTIDAQPIQFYTGNTNVASILASVPTFQLDSQAANSANAGTIVMRTSGGSESFTQTFNASTNRFHMLYGATNIVNITASGFGLNTTAFSPGYLLDVISTGTNQFRLGYNTSNYLDTRVFSNGAIYYNAVGSVPYHEFRINSSSKLQIGENVSYFSSNTALAIFGSGADVGFYLGAGYFNTFEIGLYGQNADETIAAYDQDLVEYYYFNRALYGSGSSINSTGVFNIINSSGSPQLGIGQDFDNLFQTTVEADGDVIFTANSLSISPSFTFNNYTKFNSGMRLYGVTVAGLPGSPEQGMVYYVTDASAPSWGATVSGGGSTVVPVFYDGTNWIVI